MSLQLSCYFKIITHLFDNNNLASVDNAILNLPKLMHQIIIYFKRKIMSISIEYRPKQLNPINILKILLYTISKGQETDQDLTYVKLTLKLILPSLYEGSLTKFCIHDIIHFEEAPTSELYFKHINTVTILNNLMILAALSGDLNTINRCISKGGTAIYEAYYISIMRFYDDMTRKLKPYLFIFMERLNNTNCKLVALRDIEEVEHIVMSVMNLSEFTCPCDYLQNKHAMLHTPIDSWQCEILIKKVYNLNRLQPEQLLSIIRSLKPYMFRMPPKLFLLHNLSIC